MMSDTTITTTTATTATTGTTATTTAPATAPAATSVETGGQRVSHMLPDLSNKSVDELLLMIKEQVERIKEIVGELKASYTDASSGSGNVGNGSNG
ncbi:MAG: hypothetical protein ACK4FV_07505, partial [Candidatus Nitrosocaldus sp.]